MNRKILLVVFALTVVVSAAPYLGMVQAKPSVDALFYVSMAGFGGTIEYRQAGDSNNWIVCASTSGNLEGDIEGSMTAEARWIWHFEDEWVGPELDPLALTVPHSSNGGAVLTVDPETVMGNPVTGTFILKFVAYGNEFAGTWVILGGTDDLKGITGQGTWYVDPTYGSFGGQAFEGKIHFSP